MRWLKGSPEFPGRFERLRTRRAEQAHMPTVVRNTEADPFSGLTQPRECGGDRTVGFLAVFAVFGMTKADAFARSAKAR